jgi:hypothetical protein
MATRPTTNKAAATADQRFMIFLPLQNFFVMSE